MSPWYNIACFRPKSGINKCLYRVVQMQILCDENSCIDFSPRICPFLNAKYKTMLWLTHLKLFLSHTLKIHLPLWRSRLSVICVHSFKLINLYTSLLFFYN